jgi:hypothetical protein
MTSSLHSTTFHYRESRPDSVRRYLLVLPVTRPDGIVNSRAIRFIELSPVIELSPDSLSPGLNRIGELTSATAS